MTNNLTPQETLDIIKKEFSHVDFDNRSRRKEYVLLRQLYAYFARLNPRYSFRQIAEALKSKPNHATIVHSVKTIKNYVSNNDLEIMPIYNLLKSQILVNQKNIDVSFLELRKLYNHHNDEALKIKQKLDEIVKTKERLRTRFNTITKNQLTKDSQVIVDRIFRKSSYCGYILNNFNKWLNTKESTDLLECTKAIGFNHKENFNTFKNLQQSII
jgi:hypothetical protein